MSIFWAIETETSFEQKIVYIPQCPGFLRFVTEYYDSHELILKFYHSNTIKFENIKTIQIWGIELQPINLNFNLINQCGLKAII